MACKLVVNDTESQLYNKILNAYNGDEELSKTLHSFMSNDSEFIRNFGNWQNAYEKGYNNLDENLDFKNRVEDNGEPLLYKNEKTGDFYYLDKDYNKEYIIQNTKSLNNLFTYGEIEQITKVLVYNYFANNLKIDFNDIDLNKETVSLKISIINKLNERIDKFRESGDVYFEDIADKLEEALKYNINELVDNVKVVFEQNKLSYREDKINEDEDQTLSELEQIENQKDPSFNSSSVEKNTKDAVTANVKFRLSLIEDINAEDYFLNDTVYKSFDVIYGTLIKEFANVVAIEKDNQQEDKFELLKSIVLKFTNKKPYFKELYNILSNPNISENIKSEFVVAFDLHKVNLNTTEINKEESEDGITTVDIKVINAAESAKKENDIFYVWNKNFKEDFVTVNPNGSMSISDANIKVLNHLSDKLNKLNVKQENAIQTFIEILRDLGVETTEEGFSHYLDNLQLINDDVEMSNKIFNKTITDLKYLIKDLTNNKIKDLSNVFQTQAIFKNLAKSELFYLEDNSDTSVFTAGKQKWTFSYPSYLSNTIESWKKDRDILVKHYEASEYNLGSYKMKYLLALGDTYQVDEFLDPEAQELSRIEESKRRISNISLASFNVFQNGSNDVANSENVKEINKTTYILDTVNKSLSFMKGARSFNRTTTPADKGTQYELSLGGDISVNARYGGEFGIEINQEAIDIIFGYFNAEYKRMRVEKAFMEDPNNKSKLRTYYHLGAGNAFKSQLFPSLSPKTIAKEAENFGSNFHLIYDAEGNANLETLENSEFENDIKRYIANELSLNIDNTLTGLINAKLFEQQPDSNYKNLGIDSKIWDAYKSDQELKIAADFYINSIISHVEYSKMFAGDVAYYKNGVDYKKRIPATYTDGIYQRLNDDNKSFTIAVVESINIASPFHSEIEELVGSEIASNYSKINSADAQAWITPERWKSLIESIGKWNKTYQSAYDKLIGKVNEPFNEKELKKIVQPLKGVYFQTVNGVPTFLKYSQAVLSPRIRKGNDLETLYNKMVESKVDELLTFDAIKVGSNRPSKIHNDNGRISENFELNPLKLPSTGWKLQQDLPTKTFKDTELGSQIQKNIFQGLSFNLEHEFEVNNEELFTGNEMVENIANVVGDLSDIGYQSVLQEFDIDQNGKINNLDKFYKSIISELKSRKGSKNVIDALEAEVSIYGLPQVQKKLQNIFSSIMTKRILKIQTNGGSFIQMSNFGFNKNEAEQNGVIWSPRALETTHEPQYLKDKEGNKVLSKNGKPIIRPGGVLISGSFIAKYIPDYRKYTSQELFGYTNEKGEFVKGIIDNRILENVIGYRIPNQGLSSNDALEIVGILPEENGDTIVAYTGITTKTGSDFD